MKQKTRILIYILIAAAFVILGSMAIITNHQSDKPASAQEHIDLGRIYLVDLSYEKAVLEFTEAIEIEPLNADAYLGLAEAYVGMEDIPKAVEILEEGYDKTGDERLKDMLDELQPHKETTITTAVTAEKTTDISITQEVFLAEPVEDFIIIKDVQHSTNLTELKLYGIDLTNEDIKDLDKMINLTCLVLAHNKISDISSLKNLNNLDILFLGGNQISDISPLKDLNNLTTLLLEENQISNLSPLNNLTNLTDLCLSRNQISNISKLNKLTNLDNLLLSYNEISDLSPLKNLTNLNILYLYDNQISDISSLENLTSLNELYLGQNQISNISALKGLTNLKRLDLKGNPISDKDIKELQKALPNCEITY